jgi:hypothetical protein
MSSSNLANCTKEICSTFSILEINKVKDILIKHFGSSQVNSSGEMSSSRSTTTNIQTTKCISIIKSGERKGKTCDLATSGGGSYCKRHTPKDSTEEKKEEKPKVEPKTAPKSKKTTTAIKQVPIFDKIQEHRENYFISLNAHGNYEHPGTKLVFDSTTQEVIGKQCDDGTISLLTINDIELCKENNWKFKIPLKLNTDTTSTTNTTRKPLVTIEDDHSDEEDDEEDDEDDE